MGKSVWHEVFDPAGKPRPRYSRLLDYLKGLRPSELRNLDERMQATLREMGVTFDFIRERPWGRQPWVCDLLPHIMAGEEWAQIVAGFNQRLRASECFLRDVYGEKAILRSGVLPIQPVMGSRHYQTVGVGLPRPGDAFLHLCGICLARDGEGRIIVKHHQFGHASGLSYMMQNRRALARVIPDLFQDIAVQSLVNAPLAITEHLRSVHDEGSAEPVVVLLTPGAGTAMYSQHSLLARRMGIPLVQGGDMLVLDDALYLKTVKGLKRVEVLYSRVPDDMLDPLVFRRSSSVGIPGLMHCIRKGTVKVVNAIGSQLADDRSLLCFMPRIIRFYLGEGAILPTAPTFWLGDIDQREMVLGDPDAYDIRRVIDDEMSGQLEPTPAGRQLLRKIRIDPGDFVAQPKDVGARTICFEKSRTVEGRQDHLLFALRSGDEFDVFPGALTRVFAKQPAGRSAALDWISKDTWVLADAVAAEFFQTPARRYPEERAPMLQVTSRVAEAFYWMGRYLERAYQQAYFIQVVETLETEELNSAERRFYRPMWNRLLPPLEAAGTGRRSISNRVDRYHLLLFPEPGSVASMVTRVILNGESIQECLSPEAWVTLSNLAAAFQKTRFRQDLSESECLGTTRRLSDLATSLIPQFFATAAGSMLADDGWRFCQAGQMLERAIITGNAVFSIEEALPREYDPNSIEAHGAEIQLSAFLRLLGTRDAYRRVYQMRAEPVPVLELLWQNPEVPRSVIHCLRRCAELLGESAPANSWGAEMALGAMEDLCVAIKRTNWAAYVRTVSEQVSDASDEPSPIPHSPGHPAARDLAEHLDELLSRTMAVHQLVSDGFLSHQAQISQPMQPRLQDI